MTLGWTALIALIAVLALGFVGAPLLVWSGLFAVLLYLAGVPLWGLGIYAALALILNLRPLRRVLISRHVAALFDRRGMLPAISETERVALEAGTVWMDAELFSGKPDLRRAASEPWASLREDERAFLDGPVEEACRMADDWRAHVDRDFSPELWDFLKREGFFGLIVPKEYGGRGFGAEALSVVVEKLASRSFPLSVTVMIPNSLGPAELLQHYGTDAQKSEYLPKLANGEHMPCFALTEPKAGSDAGALGSEGVVFRDEQGRLMMRLSWTKRWTSLAAVSTVIGLAFKLRDPEELLGKGKNPGITCALIPAETPGVAVRERHDPLGIPFFNSPMEGRDVVVPVDTIIGGPEMAGQGWRMLMECLSAGRGIALPGACTAIMKKTARVVGSYAAVRQQFGMPIGRFEGIEEPLARILGTAYLSEAARAWTCASVDHGQKPSVISAIVKYQLTEGWRRVVNDGMDVLAGAGITRGPRNLLASAYQAAPIPVTVEGANILTRTMIVFGQGAMRCHPHARDLVEAMGRGDMAAFDRSLFRHAGHGFRNGVRAVLLALTRGRLARSPVAGPQGRWWRKLSWASASFAMHADLLMVSLGGKLKRHEKLTGRMADALSWMYIAAATLRRFEAEGRREEDRPVLDWSMREAFSRIQTAMDGVRANVPVTGFGFVMRRLLGPLARINAFCAPPDDRSGAKLAAILLSTSGQRDRLTGGLFMPTGEGEAWPRLERAHRLALEAEGIARKIREAVRAGVLEKGRPAALLERAAAAGVIGEEEVRSFREAEAARDDAVTVDAFPLEAFLTATPGPPRGAPRAPAAAERT